MTMTTHVEQVAADMIREARMFERLLLRAAIYRDRKHQHDWPGGFDAGSDYSRRKHARSLRSFAAELLDDHDDQLIGRVPTSSGGDANERPPDPGREEVPRPDEGPGDDALCRGGVRSSW